MNLLLEPFSYDYMLKAIWVCALVGGVCAFLSSYLMLKGWSLMGDAMAHAVVPGVTIAYLLALPYALGAFFSGLLASLAMALVKQKTNLREDTIIGLVFTSFFALGLLLVSISPSSVNIQSIILGNILAISPEDATQVVIISVICMAVLVLKWRDFMAVFFDEAHARSVGLNVGALKLVFFTLLSAACVAALQTVGACLVIAMLVTPGASAYLLTDQFAHLIMISVGLGLVTSAVGAYLSYFLDANPGGLIVLLQTLIFLLLFFLAPKYGLLTKKAALDG